MLEIDVNKDIMNSSDALWFYGSKDECFSSERLKQILDTNKDEKDIKLNICCRGGSVDEGIEIYQILRNSGKNIYCNIGSACHSIALVILAAAPFENRTGDANCSCLIHNASTCVMGQYSYNELNKITTNLKVSDQRIRNILAERTNQDIKVIEDLMNEEVERTAQEMLSYGFISKINTYNTNKKESKINNNKFLNNKKMAEKKTKIENLLNRISKYMSGAVNYDFTTPDGDILFSTDKADDDDTLAVGDNATPDGTFELQQDTSELKAGSIVVIENGTIKNITPKEEEKEPMQEPNEEMENLKKENEALKKENAKGKQLLNEAQTEILNLKKGTTSNYQPPTQKRVTGKNIEQDEKNKIDLEEESKKRKEVLKTFKI